MLICPFSSVNIAWPSEGMGDAEYLYAFQRIIMPIAIEFAPELVISKITSILLKRGNTLKKIQFQLDLMQHVETHSEDVT